ncbi:response regulator [Pirellulaceae bacterium SH449]
MEPDQIESLRNLPSRMGYTKVLLIEDNPGDVALVKHYLSGGAQQEIDIVNVASIAEAESLLANKSFDSIILDLRLPDANGLEAIQKIREYASDIPIIILSGTLDHAITPELVGAGVDSFHRKESISADSLAWSLKLAIDRSKGLMNSSDTGVDEETGLFSQFGFQNVADEAFNAADASDSNLCVIWLTVRSTKETGLPADSIKRIAKLIEESVRSSDFLGRIEASSFVIAMPGVGSENSEGVCKRLIYKLGGMQQEHLGVDIGLAFLEPNVSTLSTLIVNAKSKAKPVDWGAVRRSTGFQE